MIKTLSLLVSLSLAAPVFADDHAYVMDPAHSPDDRGDAEILCVYHPISPYFAVGAKFMTSFARYCALPPR
jgi:hypothetical protein